MSEREQKQFEPGDDLLPTAQIEEETVAINFLKSLEIYAADEYDRPQFTLSKNGIGFAPLGNITAVCAEMKMGKSWLMQQFACATLRGEFMGLQSEVDEASVLWFDTEQDKYDSQMVMRRIQYICGWDFKTDNPRFHIFSMRDFERQDPKVSMASNRIQSIIFAVKYFQPKVVFIDGVRDLIDDFNDLAESARLVQCLMSLSTQCNCCIWSVLHVNPNTDKMRGHLGTELGNKVTDVFSVHKDKDPITGKVTFEVKQVAARHRDVDDWLFEIDDSKPISIPALVDGSLARRNELTVIFNEAFKDLGMKSMSYSEMFEMIHEKNKKRKQTITNWIKDGISLGLLVCTADRYTYSQAQFTESPTKAPF